MSEMVETTEPWALAPAVDVAGRAYQFPAVLALRCSRCQEMGPRSRMVFVTGQHRGVGFLRSPICPTCRRGTNAKWSLSVAVAERRAS